MRIGIAGLGTVGGTVYRTLMERAWEIEERTGERFVVSKVINRSPEKYELFSIPGDIIAEDFEDLIINSDIVVETIGGLDAAYRLVSMALEMGKVVVTANKDLVSERGNELLELAKSSRTDLYFEAAVGGGIPIISLLEDYLIFQKIRKIRGILNGTTNYILTRMMEGESYEEALKKAQELGYAEADPTKDVEGMDTAYKLSVLYGVVTGNFPGVKGVEVEGITKITPGDVEKAKMEGKKIKLIGEIDFESGKISVSPTKVDRTDPFWNVEDVENGVIVETDLAGRFFLQGRGAGGFPTATAVISDLFRVSKYIRLKLERRKPLVVMKFGGTSVGSVEKIKKVAERISRRSMEGVHPVVVVSAMGDTTDKLLEMAKSINPEPDLRELDMLLSTGEQQSMTLLSMALQALGEKAISLTGAQVRIITDANHARARIIDVGSEVLERHIRSGKIPIIAGFQGVSYEGEITTLGRGGSDTTAVAIAHALGADVCEMYTDVDGVFTADPKVVKDAKPIKAISWDEMIEMASSGATVLQARSVEFARKYGIRLLVRNAHNDSRGTLVWEGENVEEPIVRAVTFDKNVVKVVLRKVPDRPGVAARIFRALAEYGVTVDMIIQSMHTGQVNDVAFIVPTGDVERIKLENLKRRSEAQEVVIDENIAKVSLIGVNVTGSPDIAATLFETLANEGINIDMISTSNSRISVIIARDKAEDAVRAIHARFDLGGME